LTIPGTCLASLNERTRIEFTKKETAFAMANETEDKKQQRAREGAQAWADYEADRRALRERTERLRALRLARDAIRSLLQAAETGSAADIKQATSQIELCVLLAGKPADTHGRRKGH
jgi:hypothetical protein